LVDHGVSQPFTQKGGEGGGKPESFLLDYRDIPMKKPEKREGEQNGRRPERCQIKKKRACGSQREKGGLFREG